MGSYLHRYPGKGQPLVFMESSCADFWRHREYFDRRGPHLLGDDGHGYPIVETIASVYSGFFGDACGLALVDKAKTISTGISED